jgi:alkylation response protein AidB-like acyl-CoA dehydrogenase
MIADSAVEIEALRWLVLTAAWQVDHDIDSRQAQSMAKLYGGVHANEIVDRVLQIHGGMGYTRELPIERWYREARLWRIFEGTDEMQRLIISRDLLRGYTKLGLG